MYYYKNIIKVIQTEKKIANCRKADKVKMKAWLILRMGMID